MWLSKNVTVVQFAKIKLKLNKAQQSQYTNVHVKKVLSHHGIVVLVHKYSSLDSFDDGTTLY